MKRLLSLAIIAMIVTLAFAQSEQAQKRLPRTSVERVQHAQPLSAQAYADAVAKANDVPQFGATRLVRTSHNVNGFAKLNVEGEGRVIGKVARTASPARLSAPAKVTETDGNLTITKDTNGIITDVTGADPVYYDRDPKGQAFYVSNGAMASAAQSGVVTMVKDGNNVYIKNPLSRLTNGAWVKGVIDGNTLSIPTKQPLEYNSTYATTISLRWGAITTAGNIAAADNHADAFTFAIDGDVMTLVGSEVYDGSADIFYMGYFWDDDDTNTGYGDAATKLTLNADFEMPSTDLVVVPDGAIAEGWYLNGYTVSSSNEVPVKNQEVTVAFSGSDVYLQGVFEDFPTAWIKGTINGSAIEFANLQYLGTYASYDIWMIGYGEEMEAPAATYDAAAKTITFTNHILANAAYDKVFYLEWLADAVVSAEAVVYEEPVLNDKTATLPYVNGFDTEKEQAEVAILDGNKDSKTFTYRNDSKTSSTAARYAYSTSNTADDYLVFPAVQLEAGMKYVISLDARAGLTSYRERVAVVCGSESKQSALTIEVIAPTDIEVNEYTTLTNGEFTVEEDGLYTFAVKACSDPDKFYLWVDNFSISANNPANPSAAQDLAVNPDPTGANKAILTVTAPSTKLNGDALTGDLTMVVKVDGQEVLSKVVPAGEAVTEEIPVDAAGTYTFAVNFASAEGISDIVSVKAYIGLDVPTAVVDLAAADQSTKVALSWLAPIDGVNKGIIFPEDLTYNVYPVGFEEFWGSVFPVVDTENPYVTGLSATNYDVDFNTNEGEMQYSYLAVSAENAAGEGNTSMIGFITGAPYQLPVKESGAGQTLNYFWAANSDDNNYYADGGLALGENASDGDGVCFEFEAKCAGWITLESGKIALGGAANPVFQFDMVQVAGTSSVEVSVESPEGITVLDTFTPASVYAPKTFSLVDYKDADWVRVIVKAEFEDAATVDLDNIKIFNQLDHNLCAAAFNVPAKVAAGSDLVATVTVENQGTQAVAAEDYSVKFTVNGAEQTVEGVAVGIDEKVPVALSIPTSILSPEQIVVSAEIVYAADEDLANNATAELSAKVDMPNFPVPANIVASVEGTTVTLLWEEPDLENLVPQAMTEDFESYEPFQFGNAIGDWTLVDGDGGAMGGLQNLDIPNLTVGTTTGSFFLMDYEADGFNETFASHSGHQHLSTMFNYEGTQLNEWLISPALPGVAQTISFYARSYSADYTESFRVLYSTTDMDPESFIELPGAVASVPTAWTEYSYDLPEGAKYFAINCDSNDKFMLFVDDITYIPANGASADLDIVGYNVYRDGVKINEEPVAETSYVDENLAEDTTYTYAVSAVYLQGESKTSEATQAQVTGIEGVSVNAGEAVYYNLQGVRIAKPEAGTPCVRVIDGKAAKVVIR